MKMGNSPLPERIEKGFEKDGHKIVGYMGHGQGIGIRARAVTGNYVAYVSGTPYEMGYLMGNLFYRELEQTCQTYLPHMIPQFISEDFDLAMKEFPLILSIVYDSLLEWLIDILITESVNAFDESVKRGDIPAALVEEIQGMVEGAASVQAFSYVTRSRLIAANFGLDYLFSQILSGKLLVRLKEFLKQFPDIPIASRYILALPEMCNLVLASKSATLSGKDAYMMRDFQFANGRVYHKNSMILIRDSRMTGRLLNASVTMPGWIGAITGLNSAGLGCGMNMVRSEAVDVDRIGCGIMMMNRSILDQCKTVEEMEQLVRKMYTGMPWITYGIDDSGTQRVFEMIGRNVSLEGWENRYDKPKQLIASFKLDAWKGGSGGVWPRTGCHHKEGDKELSSMNQRLFEFVNRQNPSFPMFKTFREEEENLLGNSYFPLWYPQKDVTIATNTFMNPILRRTEMTAKMYALTTGAPSSTTRYGKLAKAVEKYHGRITLSECRSIISFLNPRDEPDYTDNKRKFPLYNGDTVLIRGSLSVIDIHARRLENKAGNWKNEFFGITLTYYE